MHIDHEIFEVENRIVVRKVKLDHALHAVGRGAKRGITSPIGLIGAGALGFLLAGGVRRRQGGESTTAKAAKATGIAGLLMSAAMWFIREQYGSPLEIAQLILAKVKKRGSAAVPSHPGDSRAAQLH
jgi:hypothetical protein